MNEVLKVIKNRRSIRKFLSTQISDEELSSILESGIYAPSGHNDQAWHFTVIQNKEIIQYINNKSKELLRNGEFDWMKKLAQNPATDITYGAPTLIIVSGDQNASSPKVDCAAAIENMLLAAESLNIGSVWIGLIKYFFELNDEMKKLGIPAGYKGYYAVALGYKAHNTKIIPPKRKENSINYIK